MEAFNTENAVPTLRPVSAQGYHQHLHHLRQLLVCWGVRRALSCPQAEDMLRRTEIYRYPENHLCLVHHFLSRQLTVEAVGVPPCS